LDVPGSVLTLKEPLVLNDLTQAALGAGRVEAVREPLKLVLGLLGRSFGPGEVTIVKPSNAANPLIEEVMALRPGTRALFLSSALPEFLRSVSKKGLFGRIWARRHLPVVERFSPVQTGFSQSERWEQSDLQVAALGWLLQRAQFARALNRWPERTVSLDSANLLADPGRALAAVSDFFGVRLSTEQVQTIAAGPVFARDSKRHDRDFDAAQREAEHQAIGDVVGEEIEMVVKWAGSVAAALGIASELPRPLAV